MMIKFLHLAVDAFADIYNNLTTYWRFVIFNISIGSQELKDNLPIVTTIPFNFSNCGRSSWTPIFSKVGWLPVIPPFLTVCGRSTHTAIFSFCKGVMQPMPMTDWSVL